MRSATFALLLLLLLLGQLTGCVHRRLTVRSDPPGALVMVDGEEKGFTPTAMDFNYYGTREVTLIKDGYETETVLQKVPAPWYQWVPLDFVSDNFLPFQVSNRHEFLYKLRPLRLENQGSNLLLDRANSLRSQAQFPQ